MGQNFEGLNLKNLMSDDQNPETQFFEDVIEKLMTESMFPFLIKAGIINPITLTINIVRAVRENLEKQDSEKSSAADVVTELEADCYAQLRSASESLFSSDELKSMKSMIRAARMRAAAELDKHKKASKANLN